MVIWKILNVAPGEMTVACTEEVAEYAGKNWVDYRKMERRKLQAFDWCVETKRRHTFVYISGVGS